MSARVNITDKEYELLRQLSHAEDQEAVTLLYAYFGSKAKNLTKEFAAFLKEEGLEKSEEGLRLILLCAVEEAKRKNEEVTEVITFSHDALLDAADRRTLGTQQAVFNHNPKQNVHINRNRLIRALRDPDEKDKLLIQLERLCESNPDAQTIIVPEASGINIYVAGGSKVRLPFLSKPSTHLKGDNSDVFRPSKGKESNDEATS